MNVLISACLMGVFCRYDGKTKQNDKLEALMNQYTLIPVCPEILGGLPTPRPAVEIQNGRAINKEGKDVTDEFERGAKEVLRLAKLYHCDLVILKERSPSCGNQKIYDGTFSGTLVDGNGFTAQLLLDHGIRVIGESQIDSLLESSSYMK